MIAAHRATVILAQLQFAELHRQRIEKQQTAFQAFASAQDELDCFHGLDRADDARKHTKHSTLSARRHEAGRRWFRIQAAVARTVRHAEDSDLALKSENGAVHVRLAEKDARVVYEIASGKIVRAINDNVEILEELQGVFTGELGFEGLDLDVRVEIRKTSLRGCSLRLTD